MSNTSTGCCGCCKLTTCLSGDTIDTECCLSCDELLMWSERPSYSFAQKYFLRGQDTDPSADCYVVTTLPGSDCNTAGKIVNYTVSANELEPVQTVYSFYKTYWRPINFFASNIAQDLPIRPDPICPDQVSSKLNRCAFDFENFTGVKMDATNPSTLGTMKTCLGTVSPCSKNGCHVGPDPDPTITPCAGEEHITSCNGFYLQPFHILDDLIRGYELPFSQTNNCCYPRITPSCDQVLSLPTCECNSPWLTHYRKRKLLDDYRTIWGVDIECHDEDQTNFVLTNQWMFNMVFERWWKIGEDSIDGLSQSFWNIPGLSGLDPNPTQTVPPNSPDVLSSLVPKFWIYGCSGAPFFKFELDDALHPMNSASVFSRNSVIDQSQYDSLIDHKINNIPYAEYNLQSVFESLSRGGYFESKDWRAEQLQAYKELHARFPNAGYGPYAAKTVNQMQNLGPFRKRFYASHIMGKIHAILRADKVPDSAKNLQAEFYRAYPGQFPQPSMTEEEKLNAIEDYYYWAERQWVYFRAVPAGWTWANWNAGLSLPCGPSGSFGIAPTEDAAILAGCGRASGNCIDTWYNYPQVATETHITTGAVCVSDEGEGQTPQPCPIDGSVFEETPCGCCRLRCSLTLDECEANCSSTSTVCNINCQQIYDDCISAGNGFGVCFAERANCISSCSSTYETCTSNCQQNSISCLNECSVGACQVVYPINQCLSSTDNCNCLPPPLMSCPEEDCKLLNINSYCDGVHIIATQYVAENKMQKLPNSKGQLEDVSVTYRCLWTANTFLTPAKNTYGYNSTIKKCKKIADTSMFNSWPEVRNKHIVPTESICNNHRMALTEGSVIPAYALQYFVVPACESGICYPWSVDIACCGDASGCPNGDANSFIPCNQRIQCVSQTHGKKWDARTVCPPSCGTDTPSYGTFPSGYFGGDGSTGGPTESSCERDNFLGYTPECW